MTYNILDTVKIENVVASAKLCDTIDLVAAAAKIPGAEYNKKRFPGILLRFDNPKISALLFSSGKVVLTGAKNQDILKEGMLHLLRVMNETDIRLGKNKCKERKSQMKKALAWTFMPVKSSPGHFLKQWKCPA